MDRSDYDGGEPDSRGELWTDTGEGPISTGAEIIVTYNLRDFPDSSLAPYSIIAQGPSSFLTNLHDMDPPAVMQTLEEQAEAIGRPLSYLLSRLRINVPGFVRTIE